MITYQDRWTRWHHKETNGSTPSSNNGWIYSAYASKRLPKSLNRQKLLECYNECVISLDPVKIDRSPQQSQPVLSKDEVIGMVSLGLLTNADLENSYYNFCNLESEFDRKLTLGNLFTSIKALWKIRKEHRNYAWQNNLVDTYPLLFKLMPWDVYYVRKYYSKKVSFLQILSFYLNFVSVFFGDNKSTKMLLWLQLEDLNHPLVRIIPKEKWIRNYFGESHPIYTKYY